MYYAQMECVQSYDLFIFWEISDTISLMVQDRDIIEVDD